MSTNRDVRELLTSSQVAAVLHKSRETIARWVRNGDIKVAAKIASGQGVYLFDPEIVKQKAIDLALGPIPPGETLDLDIEPKRRRAS
jgi:peptidyl-tRNA hydrolase